MINQLPSHYILIITLLNSFVFINLIFYQYKSIKMKWKRSYIWFNSVLIINLIVTFMAFAYVIRGY